MFAKKPFVIFLTSTSITIIDAQNNLDSFAFSPSVTCYSEIINERIFKSELQTFLQRVDINKGKAIMFLSEELVFFYKNLGTDIQEMQHLEKVWNTLPLNKKNIATIAVVKKDCKELYITNKNFYRCVIDSLAECAVTVSSVVPYAVFHKILPDQALNVVKLRRILYEKKLLRTYNFLYAEQQDAEKQTSTDGGLSIQNEVKTRNQTIYSILGLSFFLLVVLVIFFLLRFR